MTEELLSGERWRSPSSLGCLRGETSHQKDSRILRLNVRREGTLSARSRNRYARASSYQVYGRLLTRAPGCPSRRTPLPLSVERAFHCHSSHVTLAGGGDLSPAARRSLYRRRSLRSLQSSRVAGWRGRPLARRTPLPLPNEKLAGVQSSRDAGWRGRPLARRAR
jgi:hypothetical protein